MKVNRNLLQKLKEKNINLDIDKFSKQLKTQSNAPTQVSSSEVDSMDSSFMMQSITITPGAAALNSNFRVRPISAKREETGDTLAQSQMGFSMTQSSFNRKDSKKNILPNNSQYQHLIDMRLNQQSSQSSRSSASQQSKFRAIGEPQSQIKAQTNNQNGNNIMVKTMTQSFYKSTKPESKKDNGTKETNQNKSSIPANNEQNLLRQSSIRDRQGSADPMRVSIYKDNEQNKIREQLLNYSESEQYSDFLQDDEDDLDYNDQQNKPLRKASSQKKSYEAIEQDYENDNQIVSFNKERGRSKDSKEEKLKKASSSSRIINSRDISEEQLDSQQKLDELLQEYDKMNNDDDNSQGNSFDEELMIQVQQEFISETITAELIEKITGAKQENFDKIRRIAIRHDCEQDSLQVLGEMCPNISELNINDSIAHSLRDIGTSMRNLKILMISRVRLQDLSGLNAFPLLVELYASYNQIKNLNDLYFNENIEVLDLEGNEITDNDQIEVIETMSKVKILNLIQNPISKKDDYRQIIRQKIPQLQILDDIPIEQNSAEQITSKSSLRRRILPSSKVQSKNQEEEEEEDLYEALKKLNWNGEKFLSDDVVKELDKELKQELTEEELLIYSVKKTMTKTNKKLTIDENNPNIQMKNSNIFGQTINNDFYSTNSNFRRPQTASITSKNSNTNSTNPFAAKQTLPDSLSSLVEGTDQAFYGNPLKALKHKRKNELVTTKKNDNIDSDLATQMTIPKNIVNLLDQFKQETNDEGMNKLKEELKFYDFMVEQQINLQKKKSLGDAMNQNQNEIANDLNTQKPKIVFKRPQIKLRTTSSQAQNETKNLQSDQQFNIQQQFKDLQVKSRLPVKPTLMQNKFIENSGK